MRKKKKDLKAFDSFYYFYSEHPECFSGVKKRKKEVEIVGENNEQTYLTKILKKVKEETLTIKQAEKEIVDLYSQVSPCVRDLKDPKNKMNICDICGIYYLDQSFTKCPLCEGDKKWYDDFVDRIEKIKCNKNSPFVVI